MMNLVLLCGRHHTLVHREGFVLELDARRGLAIWTRAGRRVEAHPVPPWSDPATLDPTGRVTATTLPPTTSTARMSLGYAVSVLVAQAA